MGKTCKHNYIAGVAGGCGECAESQITALTERVAELEALVESMLWSYEQAFAALMERGICDVMYREALFIRAQAKRRLSDGE